MSKQRVFGQQVKIQFSFDGTSYEELGAVDNFSAEDTDVVKENSSLGEAGIGTIDVLDGGGNLSFEAKKTDSKLISFFYAQNKQMRGEKDTFFNGIVGKRGKNPYIKFIRTITFTDGSVEEVTYEKCAIYNMSESSSGNNEEVNEKFTGRYTSKTMKLTNEEASSTGTSGIKAVLTALTNSPSSETKPQIFNS